jgi:RNA polymerase sigma-70 factor (ECF subfamily)
MAETAPAVGTATDSERFRALAASELPKLYAIARRLVGDEAEDAVQDCLLKAFRRYGSIVDASAGDRKSVV